MSLEEDNNPACANTESVSTKTAPKNVKNESLQAAEVTVADASDSNENPQKEAPAANYRHRGSRKVQHNAKRNKFKAKNHKKGKTRSLATKQRVREEEPAIDLGDLPEDESLKAIETILQLADALSDGSNQELKFDRIYNLSLPDLRAEFEALKLASSHHAPNRDQLIHAIVAQAAEDKISITTVGVLELLDNDAGGLLVYERDSYKVKALTAYVPQAFIKHFGLQRGHIIKAQLHPHREHQTCPFVVRIYEVMGRDPETLTEIIPFKERIPYYPLSRILLEAEGESKWDNLSMRVVDCLTPVGFGQRGLIVAPPRTGKTVLLQGIANSIQKNYPEAYLIVLLIDERPEEVTDFRRQVKGEVISSTFDESAESHVHAAEIVIEKARRMVEVGENVVILLDSITRLARAYNTTMPNSGKILSGGVEANALQKPKRFFGSARNIEDGGSPYNFGNCTSGDR